jgi:hypothetical protein
MIAVKNVSPCPPVFAVNSTWLSLDMISIVRGHNVLFIYGVKHLLECYRRSLSTATTLDHGRGNRQLIRGSLLDGCYSRPARARHRHLRFLDRNSLQSAVGKERSGLDCGIDESQSQAATIRRVHDSSADCLAGDSQSGNFAQKVIVRIHVFPVPKMVA